MQILHNPAWEASEGTCVPSYPEHDCESEETEAPAYPSTCTFAVSENGFPGHQGPHEWKSKWLSRRIILIVSAVTLVFIGSLIAMAVTSIRHKGLASANLNLEVLTSIVPDFSVGIGLLWTFLPVLLFEIYALTVGAIVSAASARQPYIELHDQGTYSDRGAAPEKSILLDYQSYWSPRAPFMALKYNHYMLAFSFAIMLLLNVVLAALAAHLFFAATIPMKSDVELRHSFGFNDSAFNHESVTPIMGIVSSTLIYGGKPLPWTTLSKSFLPFNLSHAIQQGSGAMNVSALTTAYSTSLDCRILGQSEFELLKLGGDWYYSINDRGCPLSDQEYLPNLNSESSLYFVQTYSKTDCGSAVQNSRVWAIAALRTSNDDNELTNKTAVSCIPSYHKIDGLLNVTIGSSGFDYPDINSFIPHNLEPLASYLDFTYNFERQMQQGLYVDSTNALTANEYGQLIYNYAKTSNPTSFLAGDDLRAAFEKTYAAAYAVMASQYLVDSSPPQLKKGSLYVNETRIIVVLPVAYTIIGILVATLIMLGWVHVYTKRHSSILYEEPRALLGAASVLKRSDLMERIRAIDADQWFGQVSKAFDREQKLEEGWMFVDWSTPKIARIMSTSQRRAFGFLAPFPRAQALWSRSAVAMLGAKQRMVKAWSDL